MMEFELNSIDKHFAKFICRLNNSNSKIHKHVDNNLYLSALLVSNGTGNGHICLNLKAICGQELLLDNVLVFIPSYSDFVSDLSQTSTVGKPGDYCPLILDANGRLYLYRYWQYEQQLSGCILDRVCQPPLLVDDKLCMDGLSRLFTPMGNDYIDWQQVAAIAALRGRFCVITGGPGTGKTSTVVKILALALEQSTEKYLRIALAAPTGKSAARLKESITNMKFNLNCCNAIKDAIPSAVTTIHRLLGTIQGSARFRYNELNRLPHDLVVVDEASMIALPLMAKLMIALKPQARLILIGDRDQLSSVEAGAVLGDICGNQRTEPFSSDFLKDCKLLLHRELPFSFYKPESQPLSDSLVMLKKNYRFSPQSGIGSLAAAINAGDGYAALDILSDDTHAGWSELAGSENLINSFVTPVLEGYSPYLKAETVLEALTLFDKFRFLCAVRNGACGVEGINRVVEKLLANNGLIDTTETWYKGRPILITVNDYALKLFNGDIGIVWNDFGNSAEMNVYFTTEAGSVRAISPLRLPRHETVYAMTVHKSQGSEFDKVNLVLPDRDLPVVSRELIYTAITRAKEAVIIYGKKELFINQVKRTVQRTSGLMQRLWNN